MSAQETPRRVSAAGSAAWLAVRSLVWLALLPGFFAGYLPWRWFGLAGVRLRPANPVHLLGLAAVAAGVALLGWCVWEFARSGRGTLSPADPPTRLVVRGLYRHVRNPMYLSVTVIVLGEVLLLQSAVLLVYWALWFVAATLFVRFYEEPALRRRFGPEYEEYCRRVGRWLPRPRGARSQP